MKYLSIAVPCYNVEKYLHKCLTSFSDERLKDTLEVLIVDDGSKDSTPDIAKEYVARYPEIFRLIQKENGGHGSAVNAGAANATGKYFRIVDGDDWVHTDNLVLLIERLKNTDTDIVVDQKTYVDMTTGKETFAKLPDKIIFDKEYDFFEVCDDEVCRFYALHTLNVRLDIIRDHNIRILEHAFYVDNEYLLKVVAYSKKVQFIDLDVYRYLVGNVNQSVSHQSYVKRYDQHERVIKRCLEFITQPGWEPEMQAYMRRRVLPLIRTHYVIALIYNEDRAQGKKNAEAFHAFLTENYPEYAQATEKRYSQCKLLHRFGVNDPKLEKLKKTFKYRGI